MTPEKEFNPQQFRLMALMSDLSEEMWCASWLCGLERSLWEDLHDPNHGSGVHDPAWNGPTTEYQKNLDEIAEAARIAGGWVVWSSANTGNEFLTWEEWGNILGLQGPARLPERYLKHQGDSRSNLLEALSRQQLVDLVMAHGLCYEHLEAKVRAGGTYVGCLHCGAVKDATFLHDIDAAVHEAQGKDNEMECYPYDVDCDPEGVAKRVRELIEAVGLVSAT